ncbi:hypothetical protein DCS_05977 [Drechmeria coniospora]|uniref:Uncharacterized protein n=1 Tax=Drechmeria coniospora TaxID=98403 RepID=A0A151GAA4_DRECN|nr:hypothetical protein DCS_05977 [Drechmeria coniospora]KYK54023.1 hypothetical protein DCS_05977 [Drechmeria coniospora]
MAAASTDDDVELPTIRFTARRPVVTLGEFATSLIDGEMMPSRHADEITAQLLDRKHTMRRSASVNGQRTCRLATSVVGPGGIRSLEAPPDRIRSNRGPTRHLPGPLERGLAGMRMLSTSGLCSVKRRGAH